MSRVEVFADVNCPFAHVGLRAIATTIADHAPGTEVIVRAWPLEWINGSVLDVHATFAKASALREQLGVDAFGGLATHAWPSTTLPALELAALAYERDAATGLAVSLDLRTALFERGQDIGDDEVLAIIAGRHGILPHGGIGATVRADYDEGRRRGVAGSPHVFVGDDDFFCPSLDLGHDADGALTARYDAAGLAAFLDAVLAS